MGIKKYWKSTKRILELKKKLKERIPEWYGKVTPVMDNIGDLMTEVENEDAVAFACYFIAEIVSGFEEPDLREEVIDFSKKLVATFKEGDKELEKAGKKLEKR